MPEWTEYVAEMASSPVFPAGNPFLFLIRCSFFNPFATAMEVIGGIVPKDKGAAAVLYRWRRPGVLTGYFFLFMIFPPADEPLMDLAPVASYEAMSEGALGIPFFTVRSLDS